MYLTTAWFPTLTTTHHHSGPNCHHHHHQYHHHHHHHHNNNHPLPLLRPHCLPNSPLTHPHPSLCPQRHHDIQFPLNSPLCHKLPPTPLRPPCPSSCSATLRMPDKRTCAVTRAKMMMTERGWGKRRWRAFGADEGDGRRGVRGGGIKWRLPCVSKILAKQRLGKGSLGENVVQVSHTQRSSRTLPNFPSVCETRV